MQERLAIGPGRYGFRHALIRDVAYASLPRGERARLHELAAEGIAGRAGGALSGARRADRLSPAPRRPSSIPAPSHGDAAYGASVEAARIAARRGATARAQELFEQAAELGAATRPSAPRRCAPRPSWLSSAGAATSRCRS